MCESGEDGAVVGAVYDRPFFLGINGTLTVIDRPYNRPILA